MPRPLSAFVPLAVATFLAACSDDASRSVVGVDRPRLAAQPAAQPATASGPRIPGRPVPVSVRAVEAELAAARRGERPDDLRDAARYVRFFDQALTVRGLNHLAAMAASALHHERGPRADALRRRAARTYNRVAGAGLTPTVVPGFVSSGPCQVNFDVPAVLNTFADKAQATFTAPPHWVQPCGAGSVFLDPLVYSHYHLLYEDPAIDCIAFTADSAFFGRGDQNNCVRLADPAKEPRYAGPHTGKEILRMRRRAGNANLTFSVQSFVVVGDEAIKFRYRAGNGPWFQWNSLPGNAAYDVSQYVVGVTEVQITNAGTSLACGPDFKTSQNVPCPVGLPPFYVDDFSILP